MSELFALYRRVKGEGFKKRQRPQ